MSRSSSETSPSAVLPRQEAAATSTANAPRCPVCASVDTSRYCHKDASEYFACTRCQALFQHPVPDRQAMLHYAETEYAEGVYGEYVGAREMKLAHFAARMALMRPRIRVGTLLDVGCSCGYFMEVAMREGFEVRGLEFSQHAIDAARPEVRSRIIRTSVNELSGEHEQAYDVITAFDIIEHLERPLEFLQHARRLLKPGGVIVISTPDADHWLRPLMGARWPMLQPMQHLTIFSRTSMRVALDAAGFQTEVIETAHKVLSYDYLINQVRPLNPLLFSLVRGATRLVPASVMTRDRRVNIGEVLAIARQAG